MRRGQFARLLLGAVASCLLRAAEGVSYHNTSYSFGRCYDNERSLYYGQQCPESGIIHCSQGQDRLDIMEVRGLTCQQECSAGWYLDWSNNMSLPTSACAQCPLGTYSVGGGALYSGRTKIWGHMPSEFRTECIWYDGHSWHHGRCSPWTPEKNGTIISSGDNSHHISKNNKRTQSTLLLNANFVKDGHVRFRYKVDGEDGKDGLQFIVDVTVAKWPGNKVSMYQQTEWAEQTVEVPAGAHTLKWRYEKDDKMDFGDDRAYLEIVEVYGTAHSDTQCEPCYLGYSATCRVCNANEYADSDMLGFSTEEMCKSCPSGRYSAKGAVGMDECKDKPICTEDDVVPIDTDCKENSRTVFYKYKAPHICKNGETTIPLDVDFHSGCPDCNPGYVMAADGAYQCETCSLGSATDESGACAYCGEGKFAERMLVIGRNTRHGWQGEGNQGEFLFEGFMTNSMSGWDRLVRDGNSIKSDVTLESLATAPGGVTKQGSPSHGGVSELAGGGLDEENMVLPMQIDMINEGYVNFTYEITGADKVHMLLHKSNKKKKWDADKSTLRASFSAQSFDADDGGSKDSGPGGVESHGVYDLESNDGKYEVSFPLCPGRHMLRWVWTRRHIPDYLYDDPDNVPQDRMVLNTVTIVGSDKGGAHSCQVCPPGTEVDLDRGDTEMVMLGGAQSVKVKIRDRCRPCAPGTFNDGSMIACGPCDDEFQPSANGGHGSFSRAGASQCTGCGYGTVSNFEHTDCIAAPTFTVEDAVRGERVYNLSAIQAVTQARHFQASQGIEVDGDGASAFNVSQGAYAAKTVDLITVEAGHWPDGSPRLVQLGAMHKGQASVPSGRGQSHYSSLEHMTRSIGGPEGHTGQCKIKKEEEYLAFAVALRQTNFLETQKNREIQLEYEYSTVMCSSPAVYDIVDSGNVLNVYAADWTEQDPLRPYGLTAKYTQGAVDDECPAARDTTIRFVCDMTVLDGGMPVWLPAENNGNNCSMVFEWATIAACPMCDESHFEEVMSKCENGEQVITFAPTSDFPCTGGHEPPPPRVGECWISSNANHIAVIALMMGMVTIGVSCAACVMYRKYKQTQKSFNEYIRSRRHRNQDEVDVTPGAGMGMADQDANGSGGQADFADFSAVGPGASGGKKAAGGDGEDPEAAVRRIVVGI